MNFDKFTPDLAVVLFWLAFGKLLLIGAFTCFNQMPLFKRLKVFEIEISQEQTARELKASWVVFTDTFVLAVLVSFDLIRLEPSSLGNIMTTFALFFVWIEVWFYWSHRWMHQSETLWKIHEPHHLSEVNQPLTATSFSLVEKLFFYTLGWFSVPTILSWYLPVCPLGIAIYFTYYYISSSIAHANTEYSYSIQKKSPLGLDKLPGSSTGHALHHARYNVNFGLLTSVLDRVLGTYAQDTEEIQKQVSDGQSLTSLKDILIE